MITIMIMIDNDNDNDNDNNNNSSKTKPIGNWFTCVQFSHLAAVTFNTLTSDWLIDQVTSASVSKRVLDTKPFIIT